MEKRPLVATIIASVLIATGVSAIFSPRISPGLNFLFSTKVPGVNLELIGSKSFDLAEFGTTFVLSFIFCALNILLLKKWTGSSKLPSIYLLTFGTIVFLLTKFSTFSGKSVLIVTTVTELLLALAVFISKRTSIVTKIDPQERNMALFSGGFLGFYALLVLNRLTPVVIYPLTALILLPIVNFWLVSVSKKWSRIISFFPGILIPILLLFPTNLTYLLAWVAGVILVWMISVHIGKPVLPKRLLGGYIYPVILIILIGYNPLFFIGNFDSVEEGFWTGWVQHLWQRQILYKDVMVYHPPVVIWGLYLFEKISGFSLYSQRLFMHLLQVSGYIFYFLFLKKIIKRPWILAIVMLCFWGFTSTAVKNNVEIRVGLGLASLVALTSNYTSASGVLTGLALFTSVEVGLASVAASFVYLALAKEKKIKTIFKWILGLALGSAPILLILVWQGSLTAFVQQISSYASAFSAGYFNSPVDRAISLSYFHWHIFNQYIGSGAMWFEVSKITIFAALIYGLFSDKVMLTISVFALVLSRVALGRSDYFHLLFPLLVSIGLIGRALDKLAETKKVAAVVVTLALFFLGARDVVNSQFLENLVFRLQTYGRVVGEYKKYNFNRGKGILIGLEIETDQTDNLIKYIRENTSDSDYIFSYPWYPELYFLANRKNATSVDTPYAFFRSEDQAKMVAELTKNKPKIVIYNGDMNFGSLSTGALPEVDSYLKNNFKPVKNFGKNNVME